MTEQVQEGWAILEAPDWLWGGKPAGLLINAGLRVRRLSNGTATVCTHERYTRSKPDLVHLVEVKRPTETVGRWDRLNGMGNDEIDGIARERGLAAIEQLSTESRDLTDLVTYYQLAVAAVPSDSIGEQSRTAMESVDEVTIEGDELAFGNASVYAVRRSPELLHRIKLISVLVRLQHDRELSDGDTAGILSKRDEGGLVFAAGEGLHQGFYLLDQYVGPLLGALTPAIWGFASHRANGAIIFSFGRQLAGSSSVAPELLRTLPTRGADRVTEFEPLVAEAVPLALEWWVKQMNQLFGVLTDPSVFTDEDRIYRPSIHLQAVLTTEQLFSRVLSIQATDSDTNARRVLLFTVLDTIEALTGRSIEKTCDHSYATKTLDRLSTQMDPAAAQLLLPRARSGVDALREVQDGFFHTEADGRVMLRPSTQQAVTTERAAAEYLKLLRNATHGHGANKKSQEEATESLLARHDGTVPHGVALLAWLYLLDLLSQPEPLRRHLATRSRRRLA